MRVDPAGRLMKRFSLWLFVVCALATAPASGQSAPPPLAALSGLQSEQVQREVARYRADTELRVARGEITPDEAELLIAWREWQLAQQAAGLAPRAPQVVERTIVPAPPAWPYSPGPPYYAPYYAPRAPVYWGLSFCAGGASRNGWGSICF
jgi:hypothetical protein